MHMYEHCVKLIYKLLVLKGFDAVFNSIQEKLEKNLNRWEEYSRINCFITREPQKHEEVKNNSNNIKDMLFMKDWNTIQNKKDAKY